MDHPLDHQSTIHRLSHLMLWRPRFCLPRSWRIGLLALTLGSLLLVNMLFFARPAYATATPPPPPTNTPTPTTAALPTAIPTHAPAPINTPTPTTVSPPPAGQLVVDQSSIPASILPNTTFILRGTAASDTTGITAQISGAADFSFIAAAPDGNWSASVTVYGPGSCLFDLSATGAASSRSASFDIAVIAPIPTHTSTPTPAASSAPSRS